MDGNIGKSKWVNDNFVVGDLLGSGSFGAVFTVECRRKPHTLYAVKSISQSSQPKFVASEIRILKQLGGTCNVMKMFAAYREKGHYYIVLEHFPHDPLRNLLNLMSYREKLEYMKNLFISLDYLHRNNIIHRDVKPANFLYNRNTKRYALIDFGLSQIYVPSAESHIPKLFAKENMNVFPSPRKRTAKFMTSPGSMIDSPVGSPKRIRTCNCFGLHQNCDSCTSLPPKNVNKAGTPGFRPPEILLKFDQIYQTPAIDIWAAGVTFLALLLKRHPVFRPEDDFEAIAQICQLLGTSKITEVARRRGVNFTTCPSFPGVDIVKLIRFVRPGIHEFESPADNCKSCARLIYDNPKGRCICKSNEAHSMTRCSKKERLCIEVTKRCLEPDPFNRFSANTLVDILANAGY